MRSYARTDRLVLHHPRPAALFKRDHPRAIDRYIDYFGGGLPGVRDGEASGEVVLVTLRQASGGAR
jgi:hypothetical protein